MRRFGPVVASTTAFVLSACSGPLAPAPDDVVSSAMAADAVLPSASIVGEIGPGAMYEIVVPPFWNGDLVLYAHGYVDPEGSAPLTDFELGLLSQLPLMGYAVAYSSFSENGLAVKDGAQRTKQLRGVFADAVGEPGRTLLVGGSMGGLISLSLAERYPGHYDGALAVCGMVGGTRAQVEYIAHVRVLFDALFPEVLPGSLFDNPSLTPAEVAGLVLPALAADPAGVATLMAVMDATFGTPIPGTDADEVAESIVTALTFDVRGFSDVLERTHGHSPFDNTEVWYTGSLNDALLNSVVQRHEAHPDAARYLNRHYEPTGDLEIPVVTLHNVMDPLVPIFHEGRLAAAAAGAGSAPWLVQLTATETFGHCAFSAEEALGAFATLVSALGS